MARRRTHRNNTGRVLKAQNAKLKIAKTDTQDDSEPDIEELMDRFRQVLSECADHAVQQEQAEKRAWLMKMTDYAP